MTIDKRFIPARKPPTIPAVRPATVAEVIGTDGSQYTVIIHGQRVQMFMPVGSTPLAVSDLVMSRRVEPLSQLFLPSQPGGLEELWFSTGVLLVTTPPYSDAGGSELWVLTEGSDTPEYVWTAPIWELITNIALSKASGKVYLFVWCEGGYDYPALGEYGMRVYEVNRVARTVTLVAEHLTAGVWGGDDTDAVIDVAEYGDDGRLFLMCGAYTGWGNVWVFDPADNSLALLFHHPLENGYGAGIACNAARNTVYASDGVNVYSYNWIDGFVLDQTLPPIVYPPYNGLGWDSIGMISEPENDLMIHTMQLESAGDQLFAHRDGDREVPPWYGGGYTGWGAGADDPTNTTGNIALCNLFDKTTGALEATYAMAWGWSNDEAAGTLYRKSPGGVWTKDGQLPYVWAGPPAYYRYAHWGLATQGIVQCGAYLYMLTWLAEGERVPPYWAGDYVAAEDSGKLCLWRRNGPGDYTLLWKTAEARDFIYSHANATGAARAPSPTAGAAVLAAFPFCDQSN